jgi:hypothetical protein
VVCSVTLLPGAADAADHRFLHTKGALLTGGAEPRQAIANVTPGSPSGVTVTVRETVPVRTQFDAIESMRTLYVPGRTLVKTVRGDVRGNSRRLENVRSLVGNVLSAA